MHIVFTLLGVVLSLFLYSGLVQLIIYAAVILLSAVTRLWAASFSILLIFSFFFLAIALLLNLYGEFGGIGFSMIMLVSYLIGKWQSFKDGAPKQEARSIKKELVALGLGFLVLCAAVYFLFIYTVVSGMASFLLLYGFSRVFGLINDNGIPVTETWGLIYIPTVYLFSIVGGLYFSFKQWRPRSGDISEVEVTRKNRLT